MAESDVLWQGKVDDVETRIRRLDEDDCFVEEKYADRWRTSDDERASHVYMTAFLEARSHLNRLYDRDMGNLNLKSGLDALQGVGAFLGRDG